MTNIAMENPPMFKNGKPSITGPFSMAMLNNQRVGLKHPFGSNFGMVYTTWSIIDLNHVLPTFSIV